MWCKCLKNDCWIIKMHYVLTLPCHGANRPCPTHTVNRFKHPGATCVFIFCHGPLSIFIIGGPQVLHSIDYDLSITESSQTFQDEIFPNANIVINGIGEASISKDSHGWVIFNNGLVLAFYLVFILDWNKGSCFSLAFAMVLKRSRCIQNLRL